MRILSLDTSFSFINITVLEEGRPVLIHYEDTGKKTLEVMPLLLERLSLRPENFDAFAVCVGVGYLTSLRIGITFVKTWAYTLKRPVVTYETLELLGKNTPLPYPRVPFLKVSNNVFYRVISEDGVSEVKLYKGETLPGYGISLEHFRDLKLGEKQYYHPAFPFSLYGAIKAYNSLKNNPEGENPFLIEPLYLKPPA